MCGDYRQTSTELKPSLVLRRRVSGMVSLRSKPHETMEAPPVIGHVELSNLQMKRREPSPVREIAKSLSTLRTLFPQALHISHLNQEDR